MTIMDKRQERRLKFAANPRLRRHNHKRQKRKARFRSNVAGLMEDLSEEMRRSALTDEGRAAFHSDPFNNPNAMAAEDVEAAFQPIRLATQFAVAAVVDAADAVRARREKRRLAEARKAALTLRRKYYKADAEKRKRQRNEVEAARVKPTCECPTPAKLMDAYRRRREDDECRKRFGTLMIDLEEHVRRTFLISGNKFTGSAGGVRDWLKKHCPLLAKHYSTCQYYKRLFQDDPFEPDS